MENPRIPPGMEGFRRQLFETPSVPDRREAVPIRDTKWNLVKPITVSEIDAMLKGMSNGATGLDRITLRQLKAIPTTLLARMFNLWLVAEALPKQLQKGRTSFIPKVPGDLAPPKFRPITVSSFITRLIHRTLAKRFSEEISVEPRQKAFVPINGCAEDLAILQALIAQAHTLKSDVHVAFLDMAKAFDSISHESLEKALARNGVLPCKGGL